MKKALPWLSRLSCSMKVRRCPVASSAKRAYSNAVGCAARHLGKRRVDGLIGGRVGEERFARARGQYAVGSPSVTMSTCLVPLRLDSNLRDTASPCWMLVPQS